MQIAAYSLMLTEKDCHFISESWKERKWDLAVKRRWNMHDWDWIRIWVVFCALACHIGSTQYVLHKVTRCDIVKISRCCGKLSKFPWKLFSVCTIHKAPAGEMHPWLSWKISYLLVLRVHSIQSPRRYIVKKMQSWLQERSFELCPEDRRVLRTLQGNAVELAKSGCQSYPVRASSLVTGHWSLVSQYLKAT